MRSFRRTLLPLLALAVSASAFAENPPGIGTLATTQWGPWEDARVLYDAGKYEEALGNLLSQQGSTASYFYNIGTVYYRLGKPGASLAYLEKANRLKPHDSSIQQNLQLARNEVSRIIGGERLDGASNWIESLADRISLNEVRATLGLVSLLLSLLWLRSYMKTRSLGRTLLQPAGILGLCGVAITGALYSAQRLSEAHPPAIGLERQVIRSGPGERFVELGQLDAGMKIRLLDQSAHEEAAATSAVPGAVPGAVPTTTPVPGASPSPHAEVAASDAQSSPTPPPQGRLWRQIRYSQEGIGWVPASSLLLL